MSTSRKLRQESGGRLTSGVVVTSGTGGGATVAQPAVDAQNSRCAEHHPDSPLRAAVGPSRAQPAALCFFKQKINRALKARLAAWEVQVRTAISDQLTGRLEAIAEERDTQLHRHTRCTVTLEPRQRQCMVMGGEFCDMHTEPAGQSNVHLEHASDSGPTGLSGRRLTQAAEGRALQWASLGVTSRVIIRTKRGAARGD